MSPAKEGRETMKHYHDLPEVSFPHVRTERNRRVIYRDQFTRVSCYAPGDGDLSFVVADIRTTKAIGVPTEAEARDICPDGWEVYMDGPYPRARKPETAPCVHEYGMLGVCRKCGEVSQ